MTYSFLLAIAQLTISQLHAGQTFLHMGHLPGIHHKLLFSHHSVFVKLVNLVIKVTVTADSLSSYVVTLIPFHAIIGQEGYIFVVFTFYMSMKNYRKMCDVFYAYSASFLPGSLAYQFIKLRFLKSEYLMGSKFKSKIQNCSFMFL